jgi:hypothetical protein
MPAKKKVPVVETGDVYIVVDRSQQVFFFNEVAFYDFINQRDTEISKRRPFNFFSEFPLPRPGMNNLDTNGDGDRVDKGRDSQHRAYGRYCPFQSGIWAYGDLVVLKNGKIFVPVMQEVTRVVREYCPPFTDATPPVDITKIVTTVAKAAPKKTVKKTRK